MKSLNKSKNIHKNEKIFHLLLKILFSILFINIVLSLVTFAHAETKYPCLNVADYAWTYRMTLKDTGAFDKMPFSCRVFGFFCDANNPSLNPMQKEAMKIYKEKGDEGDYMPIIHKYSLEYFNNFFENWFCSNNKVEKQSVTFKKDMALCPETLRCGYQNFAEVCSNFIFKDFRNCEKRCPMKNSRYCSYITKS
jgi:hypothetical protein